MRSRGVLKERGWRLPNERLGSGDDITVFVIPLAGAGVRKHDQVGPPSLDKHTRTRPWLHPRERARKTKKSIFNPSDGSDTRDVKMQLPLVLLLLLRVVPWISSVHVRCEVTSSSAFLSLSFSFLICRTHLCKSVRDGRACNPWVFYSLTSVGRLNLNLSVAKGISQYC